ncbi:MAG: hypothetical protein QW478_08895 [Candidatus Micrarchaeaceae archaeon]
MANKTLAILLLSLAFIGIASASSIPYSYPTNVTSITGYGNWLNQTTGNLFWTGILFLVFLIETFGLQAVSINTTLLPKLLISSLTAMLGGLALLSLGWVSIDIPLMFGIISAVVLGIWIATSGT